MLLKDRNITIAVLPFEVISDENRIKSLFIGFTRDLINNFSKFMGLSVISHISTSHLKEPLDQAVIDQLGAEFLITGNVLHFNEKLKISIQLVKTKDKSLVFAGEHVENLKTLLEAQDAIINQIVSVFKEKINIDLLSHSYKKESVELAAYENYLLGMNTLQMGSPDSDVKARAYFNAALKINPHYSLAYTGLSLSYFNFWSCQLWDRWDVSEKGAYKYAQKALEINPNDYIALGILGRNYVYMGEYDKAEHCLRKSLRLNSNDTSHLFRVSFSLMYLGFARESVELYLEAIRLNPFHSDFYFAYGSSYYLETGDFKTSIELSKKCGFDVWADFPAYVAAAYLQLGNLDKVWECWGIYLKKYKKAIYSGNGNFEEKAIEWLIMVNPFRGDTYLYPLIEFIKTEKNIETQKNNIPSNIKLSSFINKGNVWQMSYDGSSVIRKDIKGFHDIHKLLEHPNVDFHCMDLMEAVVDERSQTTSIDQKAKAQYQKRIKELQLEIEDAEAFNQIEKIEALREEYDSILDHLSESLGLSGKTRKIGSTIEKARSAVTWRIRNAVKKIDSVHPKLATHLSKSIKTGTFCSYRPEVAIDWTL